MKLRFNFMIAGMCIAVAGVVLLGLAPRLGISRPEPLSLLIFGIGFSLMGLDGVFSGEYSEGVGTLRVTSYGLLARLRGGVMVLSGLAICGGSLVEMSGPGSLQRFLEQPAGQGSLMIGLSLLGLLQGSSFLTGSYRAATSRSLACLTAVPGVIFGVLMTVASLVLLSIGVLRLTAPATLETFFQQLLERISGNQ